MAHATKRFRMDTDGTSVASIKLKVVALKQFIKVRHWDLSEEAKPKNAHTNTVAGVTDGDSVFKFTLFSDLAAQVEEGHTYIFKNYQKAKYGSANSLLCCKDTRIYCCAPMLVAEEIEAEARSLVCPPSANVNLKDIKGPGDDLVTVEGSITAVSFWRLA